MAMAAWREAPMARLGAAIAHPAAAMVAVVVDIAVAEARSMAAEGAEEVAAEVAVAAIPAGMGAD